MPFFSICIPVYKNIVFLERLLQSVLSQTFQDFEIIITDDSPDDTVGSFIAKNYQDSRVRYFRNPTALGTPENWNEGIRQSQGEWIKLMHDDDWFASVAALQVFYDTVQKNNSGFYFSAYNNVFLDDNNAVEPVNLPELRWRRVLAFPPALYARNVIGPPSVILVKRSLPELYDSRMKWLVDIDYYIRVMRSEKPVYIPTQLINVGMGREQVTQYTHNKPAVEIPEGLLLHSKQGDIAFRNILYYDAWWRLIRNLGIRSLTGFAHYSGAQSIPSPIAKIIKRQAQLPVSMLKKGIFSKAFMFASWLTNRP